MQENEDIHIFHFLVHTFLPPFSLLAWFIPFFLPFLYFLGSYLSSSLFPYFFGLYLSSSLFPYFLDLHKPLFFFPVLSLPWSVLIRKHRHFCSIPPSVSLFLPTVDLFLTCTHQDSPSLQPSETPLAVKPSRGYNTKMCFSSKYSSPERWRVEGGNRSQDKWLGKNSIWNPRWKSEVSRPQPLPPYHPRPPLPLFAT